MHWHTEAYSVMSCFVVAASVASARANAEFGEQVCVCFGTVS